MLEIIVRVAPLEKTAAPSERPYTYYLPPQAHSARGNVFTLVKDPKIKRIAVVGDSFTFGPKLHFFDTFPARLEKLLNLNSSFERVEVINYGTPGFSTHDEVALVNNAIKANSDLIILEITLNDAQKEPLRRNPLLAPQDHGILSYSKLFKLLSERIEAYRSRARYIDYHLQLFSTPQTQKLFVDSISKMKKKAELQNIPLVAVIFPLFDFPIDNNYPFQELHSKISSILKTENIPLLDLTSAFYGIDVRRLQLIPDKDSHPNEIGHRIAADAIYVWLKELKVLPPSLFAVRAYRSRDGVYEKRISDKEVFNKSIR